MAAGWLKSFSIYTDKRMLTMLGFGFSSGFPLLLVSSTLSLWLKEASLSYIAIGAFSLVKIPYSFKWLWSPLIDRIRLPFFDRFGRRRGWALFIQLCLLLAILGMSAVNPTEHTSLMAWFALLVAGCSASQDIILDAYRIDSFNTSEQGAGSAVFVLGYRAGMLFSGAFALYLANNMSWHHVYVFMSLGTLVGIVTVLLSQEPYKDRRYREHRERLPFRPRLMRFLEESVWEPLRDFIKGRRWGLILLLILLYRLSDEYKAPMSLVFYDDMGFDKLQIASVSKIYGMFAAIIGGLFGGVIVKRWGLRKSLIWACVLQGLTNVVYIGLAYAGNNIYMLAATVCADNLAAGMATTALVAYISSLCNVAYSATQYALLSSFMSLSRDVISSTSGLVVAAVSWPEFFAVSSALVIPPLLLLWYMSCKKVI